MKPEAGKFYVHDAFKDVMVRAQVVRTLPNGNYLLQVEWWNRGCMGKPWPIGEVSPLLIKTEQLDRWTEYVASK